MMMETHPRERCICCGYTPRMFLDRLKCWPGWRWSQSSPQMACRILRFQKNSLASSSTTTTAKKQTSWPYNDTNNFLAPLLVLERSNEPNELCCGTKLPYCGPSAVCGTILSPQLGLQATGYCSLPLVNAYNYITKHLFEPKPLSCKTIFFCILGVLVDCCLFVLFFIKSTER